MEDSDFLQGYNNEAVQVQPHGKRNIFSLRVNTTTYFLEIKKPEQLYENPISISI